MKKIRPDLFVGEQKTVRREISLSSFRMELVQYSCYAFNLFKLIHFLLQTGALKWIIENGRNACTHKDFNASKQNFGWFKKVKKKKKFQCKQYQHLCGLKKIPFEEFIWNLPSFQRSNWSLCRIVQTVLTTNVRNVRKVRCISVNHV